ncbi:MAG: hypothetical protein RL885_26890 [Planctomycetota bacterium]
MLRLISPLLVISLLTASTQASADCDGDAGYQIEIASTHHPIGANIHATIRAPQAATAYVLLSNSSGPTPSPAGPLCVGFPLLDLPYPMQIPESGELTFDCFVPCSEVFLQGSLHVQFLAVSVVNQTVVLGRSNAVELTFFDNGCRTLCPAPAEDDSPYFSGGAGHVFWTSNCIGTDFVFVAGGETFVEYGDGTARMTGVLESKTQPGSRWLLDVLFSDRVDPTDASYPPSGSPKKELSSTAYVENGGPIDPSTWHYYLQTEGVLVGLEDNAGCTASLNRNGPAFQVGIGASGKNVNQGASGWLNLSGQCDGESPFECKGDFNIDLDVCN